MPSTLAQSDVAHTFWSCALVVFGLFVCFAWLFSSIVFNAVVAVVWLFFGTIMTYSCCEGFCQDCLLFFHSLDKD